ncbi:hypothetical protein BYT27DRAFT_7196267 [Phlegmacium glaucopus]|nr:hypothetical protein BYT27DRAFT_7196267 [Phlegmacium glaucopus]
MVLACFSILVLVPYSYLPGTLPVYWSMKTMKAADLREVRRGPSGRVPRTFYYI